MKMWEVWAEGYRATCESGDATLLGKAEANTFEEACRKVAEQRGMHLTFSIDRPPAYWGCRLFDNEKDARKAFG
jgi:hypothetical protein